MTSARGMTVVRTSAPGAVPLLLLGFGSAVVAVLAATFDKIAASVGAVTLTVKFVVAPMGRTESTGQPTTPPALVPPLLALTKVAKPGNVSATATPVAAEGPMLVIVMV